MTGRRKQEEEIQIPVLQQGVATLRVIGVTPLFQNRMAKKAQETLLVGGRKKTSTEKRTQIKHDPLSEYRNSVELMNDDSPTAVGLKVVAFKKGMCTAALETAGITKSSAQRLLFLPGEYAPLYGVPQLRMDVVRSADINKTPDIRTRAFFPVWGAELEVRYITPQLSMSGVLAMLCNAGVLAGIGDNRQEKGNGSFGSFRVISDTQEDAEWTALVKHGGRAAQLAALKDPQMADERTEELLAFHAEEVERRR